MGPCNWPNESTGWKVFPPSSLVARLYGSWFPSAQARSCAPRRPRQRRCGPRDWKKPEAPGAGGRELDAGDERRRRIERPREGPAPVVRRVDAALAAVRIEGRGECERSVVRIGEDVADGEPLQPRRLRPRAAQVVRARHA